MEALCYHFSNENPSRERGEEEGGVYWRERLKTFSDFRRAVYWREAFKNGRTFIGGFTLIKAWT